MNQTKRCLPSFSVSLLILLISFCSKNASGEPLTKWCVNSPYDPLVDTGYAANLNSLLSSFSVNFSAWNNDNNYRFNTSTSGVRDVVYGLYLCRGDINKTDCEACVQTASKEIVTECPNNKTAIVWYDNCMLRYSNQTDFPNSGPLYMWVTPNSTDPERFSDAVGNMMNELAMSVSSDVSGAKFGVKEGSFSAFEKLFSLAQCIPDLSSSDCASCLSAAINVLPNCCEGRFGIKVFSSNCNIRYETFRFYNVVPSPPPAQAPPPWREGKKGMSARIIISIIVSITVALIMLIVALVCLRKRTKMRHSSKDGEYIPTIESLNYSLSQVQNATNNFSEDCKIGQGGFGPVYKGILPNGENVAVKRLSQSSVQGLEEFKNEILLLARLQHRNLVRLLGFCFENQEKILLYEFFPNMSLDHFLFGKDPKKRQMLNWSTRYKIVGGIARGLLYLHEDSRLRIIHRDLKASNVLLDENMYPKIADFGTARLLKVDQSEENTERIAGTYGYMAPEYGIYGHISVKSDVFSFGVLLLEIISGKRNNSFYQSDGVDDLLSYAWKNFSNGTPMALLDPSVGELYAKNDVIRCIHIGLLCVQNDVDCRPTMASVVVMLSTSSLTLSVPLQPAFFSISHTRTCNMMQPEHSTEQSSDTSTNKSSSHSIS